MSRLPSQMTNLLRLGRWGCLGCALVCLGLAGCETIEYVTPEGEVIQAEPPPGYSEFRPPDRQSKPFAVTNKGMEIEQSLGIQ